MRRRRTLVVLLTLLALVAAACSGGREEVGSGAGGDGSEYPDPGINDEEILIGSSLPSSGPASAFGTISRSAEAYFRFVNEEKGGVTMGDGKTRKLRWIAYDDGYLPPRTVENVRRLIEQDEVFALSGVLGTPTNSAIWDLVEEAGVPNLFVQTGATKWGADIEDHRMTIGGLLAYSTETLIYFDWLRENRPQAKIAVLHQNDDFGRDYYDTIVDQIEASGGGMELVAEQTFESTDPDVSSQMINLAQSPADTFFVIATGKFPVQAIANMSELGWDPLILMHSPLANIEATFKPAGVEASTGAMSVKYVKESGDPRWADDPAMKEYEEKVVQYGENIEVLDYYNAASWLLSEALVQVLEQTPEPTRESLIETIRNLDSMELGLLYPGVTMSSGPNDGFLIESGQLTSFNGTYFDWIGDLVSKEGETPTENVPGVD